jgi:hypothetical protein
VMFGVVVQPGVGTGAVVEESEEPVPDSALPLTIRFPAGTAARAPAPCTPSQPAATAATNVSRRHAEPMGAAN